MTSGSVIQQGVGRFAPSPTGDFHVGNLRTAILAWAWARNSGRSFVLRMEDIDRVRSGSADRQIADLHELGWTTEDAVEWIGRSLGIDGARTAIDIADALPIDALRALPLDPWVVTPPTGLPAF